MEERAVQYAEVAKLFGFVLNQYRLYSANHPVSRQAVATFYGKLEQILGVEATLTLGFLGGELLANDVAIDSEWIGVAELVRESQRLHLESLVFQKGVTEEETSAFFKVLAMPPRALEQRGGLAKAFEEESLQHVRLGTARYRMVKEGEEVVDKSEIGGEDWEKAGPATQAGRTIDRVTDLVGHCLGNGARKVDFDFERLIYEIEKKPEAIAGVIVGQAKDLAALTQVVECLRCFVADRLAPRLLEAGRDFSPSISRLARGLRKAMEAPAAPQEFKTAAADLAEILERCADRIRLELVVRAFVQSGSDLNSLIRAAERLLRTREVRKRLKEPLRERMVKLGLGEKEQERVLAALEEPRPARRSPKVEILPDEYEELSRLKLDFERELEKRVGEATATLERDKRRIQNEKERVDSVIRNLAAGLVVVGVDGKIQVMNPAAQKLLGLNQAEGKGVPLSQVLTNEHLLALARGPLNDEGDRLTKEIELWSVDDETRRVLQASTAVIENESGKTVGMVSVLSDITRQKEIDEAKSKFVAHVSHELRTPLVAIGESLAVLMREEAGAINSEQAKFLDIARRNISRLSRLVNDLLDVARLEAGRMDLRPASFPVKDLLHHVIETVGGWAHERGIILEEKYPEEEVTLEADPDRLIQVVTNLLGNALKFTPQHGRIALELDGTWQDQEISRAPCVAISVQDSGIGIPLEDRERIFKKFEQVHLASPDGMSSTGLGLTIAKEIVNLHGGKIWVESNQGEGSRFIFVIPTRIVDRLKPLRNPAEPHPTS